MPYVRETVLHSCYLYRFDVVMRKTVNAETEKLIDYNVYADDAYATRDDSYTLISKRFKSYIKAKQCYDNIVNGLNLIHKEIK